MDTLSCTTPLKNQSQPIASVIIVVYNAVSTIKAAIESVTNQLDDIELLIVDGGSTDGTLATIRQYDHAISYWVSEPDKGIYDAMNKGVRNTKGKWIYFLGADDQLMPDVLTTILPVLKSTHADLVYGSVVYDDHRLFESTLNWKTLLQNTVHHQAAFYKKTLFDDFQYNTSIKIMADYELNLIAWKKRIKTQKIDIIVARCKSGGSSFDTNLSLKETNLIRQRHTSKMAGKTLSFLLTLKYFVHYVLLRKI